MNQTLFDPQRHLNKLLYCEAYIQMQKQNIYIHSLDGKTFFPYNQCRFSLAHHAYDPEHYENLIGFVTKLDEHAGSAGVEGIDGVSRYGSLVRIKKVDILAKSLAVEKGKQPTVNYLGLTFARFKILQINNNRGNRIANVEIYSDQISKQTQNSIENDNLLVSLRKELGIYYDCVLRSVDAESKKQKLEGQTSANKLVYAGITDIQLPIHQKLVFLQMDQFIPKIQLLITLLREKTQKLRGVLTIEEKVREEMSSRKKNLTKSLQDSMGMSSEKTEIVEKMNSKQLPETVKAEIEKEMKNLGFGSDKAVAMRYIETLLDIPWQSGTQDIKDLSVAERMLNEDHTGLKEVKERVLQHLAVKFRNGNSRGNVICLHGPPGVGKTSIAKSIAKALGRSFTRVSLGGMNDESELRGHRRTYVAALPGVIVRTLVKAKSNNPVILLDEIEKMGRSHKGDPENALLEILDPSQNSSFVDHYVGLPLDLSKVMFICTANSLSLSGPLLNRLQLIEVPGYSREQKMEIARNHLIPFQLRQNGVEGLAEFETGGVEEMIKYSSQLGVRELERAISKICRKVARKGRRELVTRQRVEEYLGRRHRNELWSGIGVVNGLAWTDFGGKVLTVECLQYRSEKQRLQVTGQLGEVMKESAEIAFSWVKFNFEEMGLFTSTSRKTLEETSLHIHFPDGATKKDGPSAGITIVACLASLLLKVPPKEGLAMTGEITLSGKVLPVGGVREKCLAAIYQGIKHIIIPESNFKDLDKIEEDLRKQANFYPVKEIKEMLAIAFPFLDKPAAKL